jgi:hypothetical protein
MVGLLTNKNDITANGLHLYLVADLESQIIKLVIT